MAKRCFGLTWGFNRCTAERQKLPVCNKHMWQFVQLIVALITIGAVVVTIELFHKYESRLKEFEKKINVEAVENADHPKDDQYKQWETE